MIVNNKGNVDVNNMNETPADNYITPDADNTQRDHTQTLNFNSPFGISQKRFVLHQKLENLKEENQ